MPRSNQCVLFSCRHPGPLASILEVARQMEARAPVFIAVTDTALSHLLERFTALATGLSSTAFIIPEEQIDVEDVPILAGNFISVPANRVLELRLPIKQYPSKTQLVEEDHHGIDLLSDRLRNLIQALKPQLIVRSTPSEDIGIDELIGRSNLMTDLPARLWCLLDEPGIGVGLSAERHPNLRASLDGCIVQSEECAALVQQHLGLPTRYFKPNTAQCHKAETYDYVRNTRRAFRADLGIPEGSKVVLVALNHSRYYQDLWMQEVLNIVRTVTSIRDATIYLALRPHPRTPQELVATLQEKTANIHSHSVAALECGWFEDLPLIPDIIISHFSDLNLQMLRRIAAMTSNNDDLPLTELPISIYIADSYTTQMVQKVGWINVLPRHLPLRGSLVTSLSNLHETISGCIANPTIASRLRDEAIKHFQSDSYPPSENVMSLML